MLIPRPKESSSVFGHTLLLKEQLQPVTVQNSHFSFDAPAQFSIRTYILFHFLPDWGFDALSLLSLCRIPFSNSR